jgi:hypothetical protein
MALAIATLASGRLALAAAPSNDNIANATAIPLASFTDRINTAEATVEAGELNGCGYALTNTVWYRFSPGGRTYNVYPDTYGSDYATQLAVYLVTADGDVYTMSCAGPHRDHGAAR